MSGWTINYQRMVEGGSLMAIRIDDGVFFRQASELIMRDICRQVAERYVAENYQDIIKLVSPEAIATLSAAEAAAKIRETLEKKIPDKIMEVERTRTEIYQRGILGGIKRIL